MSTEDQKIYRVWRKQAGLPDPQGGKRRTNFDVSWNAQDLGGLEKVDNSKMAMLLDPISVGSTGKMKLDDRYIGLTDSSAITVQVTEVTRAMFELAFPWFSGTTAVTKIDLTPPVNTLIAHSYAQALLLHPRDKTATVNEDVLFYKTVPVQAILSRDGRGEDVWDLTFMIYPDISKLPNNPYGEIKAAA